MLDHIGFLWAATAIVWVGTMVYIISLYRRQGHLQQELDTIQQTLKEELERR